MENSGKIVIAVILLIFIPLALSGISSASSPARTYNLTVQQQGLPPDTSWTGYITNHTTTYSISTTAYQEIFIILNGTYEYFLNDTKGYDPLVPTGYFTISGGNYTLTAQYISVNSTTTYSVDFIPKGLPADTNWTLNINSEQYIQNSSVTLHLKPGNYSFSASASGYAYNTSYIFVDYNTSVNLTFYSLPYTGNAELINNFLLYTLHITLTAFYEIVTLIIGSIMGIMFAGWIEKTNQGKGAFFFSIPIVVFSLVGAALSFIPYWIFYVTLLCAVSGVILYGYTQGKEVI